ncbi:MAG TPA: hypothetical protein VK043_08140 [Burkholderiales bacterium]|nr:hypothetical protein [Burkholderiales bacterium]
MVLELIGSPTGKAALGPAPWYRLDGARLFAGDAARPLAEYSNGFWHTDTAHFSTVQCHASCTCHFERGTALAEDVEGPYADVSLFGGVLWGDEQALARLDPSTGLWRLLRTGNDYGCISWRPASRPARQNGPLFVV